MRIDQLKEKDIITFENGNKAKVISRFDSDGKKFVCVEEIVGSEGKESGKVKIMEIHIDDGTLENIINPELLKVLSPLVNATSKKEDEIISEYDGKKYSIDDYFILVEAAINNEEGSLDVLFRHSEKLRETGINRVPYGLTDWLFFLAEKGKTKWAIEMLYYLRNEEGNKESAIWAMEAGVEEFEKKGKFAPQNWYTKINSYYYNQIDETPDNDHEKRLYLMDITGQWYKKGIAAGCDPNTLSGSVFAEKTTRNNNSNSNDGDKGGCYIATCVYGSYDCPPVWTLRRFRDKTLSRSFLGRAFIKCYYDISPKLVSKHGNNRMFVNGLRKFLDKLVLYLKNKGLDDSFYIDE